MLGSCFGIAISYLGNLNIFSTIGISIPNATDSFTYIITGLTLGSGSQFLHGWLSLAIAKKDQIKDNQNTLAAGISLNGFPIKENGLASCIPTGTSDIIATFSEIESDPLRQILNK